MFLRKKELSLIPVFETPTIKLWSNELKGYTGQNKDGLFQNDQGLTGCTAVPGIETDKVIYETKFLAEIAGDEIAYFADYEDGEIPDLTTVISGAIILPKIYEGMAFDNTVKDSTGKVFYQLVKGALPKSVEPFLRPFNPEGFPSYTRYTYGEVAYTTGMTAGDNYENNVVLIPVYYTDYLNQSLKNTKKDIIFSLDAPVSIRPGVWRSNQTSSIRRYQWPPGNRWGSYLCFQGSSDTCGGIPFSYYQTIPETIDIISLNLAVCQTDNNKQIVSITDTNRVNRFSYQKALIDSERTCPAFTSPDEICPPVDPLATTTIANEQCNAPSIPVEDFNTDAPYPLKFLGKGVSSEVVSCTRFPVVSCDPTPPQNECEGINCADVCPGYRVAVVYTTSYRYTKEQILNFCENFQENTNNDARIFILPAENDAYIAYKSQFPFVVGPYSFSDGTGRFVTEYREADILSEDIVVIPACGLNPTKISVTTSYSFNRTSTCPNGLNESGGDSATSEYYYSSSCPNTNRAVSCCCCGYQLGGIPCEVPPPAFDITLTKYANTTNIVANPFLIYLNNPAYYTANSNELSFPKYVENYFTVYANYAQKLYPNITGYKALFKNPICSNKYGDYFFADITAGFTAGGVTYNTEICSQIYTTLPNPLVNQPLFRLYDVPVSVSNTNYFCRKNIKHGDLQKYSFNLACLEKENPDAYTDNTTWKNLEKEWPMKRISYYGPCNGEGITLDIKIPSGLTLTDCTNVLSWEFLKNAPK